MCLLMIVHNFGTQHSTALLIIFPLVPGFHHSVAVLPLQFCRSIWLLPFPYTVAVATAVAYLFAVYGCKGMEFSYVIFTEQQNFTTVKWQQKNSNRMVETGHYPPDSHY